MITRRLVRTTRVALLTGTALLLGNGCTTVPDKDYSLFRANMPRSILVLPPLNETVDADATYSYLTVASEAIGEQGFYVYPVAVVDAFMKENGLPGPEEMHAVPLAKIGEIFGADAVLYITLEEFGQKFELLSSTTRVRARASLVDVKSARELWNNDVAHAIGNNSTGGGALADLLLAAAITQIGNTATDRVHDAARVANRALVAEPGRGFLYGPRHPKFGTEESEDAAGGQSPAEAPPAEVAPGGTDETTDPPS